VFVNLFYAPAGALMIAATAFAIVFVPFIMGALMNAATVHVSSIFAFHVPFLVGPLSALLAGALLTVFAGALMIAATALALVFVGALMNAATVHVSSIFAFHVPFLVGALMSMFVTICRKRSLG
jgi:uncharacterized integral membrane protein